MPHYKDTQNNLHFIDSTEFESCLPVGCMLITDEEANATTMAASLPDPKIVKWELIKEIRTQVKAGGVLVDGYWFHSDQESRIQYLGLILMGANIPAGLMWKTMNGSFIEMTSTIVADLLAAVGALDIAAFTAAEVHKAALNLSNDPATYDFSTDWPTVYSTS